MPIRWDEPNGLSEMEEAVKNRVTFIFATLLVASFALQSCVQTMGRGDIRSIAAVIAVVAFGLALAVTALEEVWVLLLVLIAGLIVVSWRFYSSIPHIEVKIGACMIAVIILAYLVEKLHPLTWVRNRWEALGPWLHAAA